MSYYFFLPFAAFLTDIASVVLITTLSLNRKIKIYLGLFYLCIAVWNLTNTFFFLVNNIRDPEFGFFIAHHFMPGIPGFFLLFVMELTRINPKWIQRIIIGFIISFLVAVDISYLISKFNGLFINGISHFSWGYYPMAGTMDNIYSVFSLLCVMTGLYFLYLARHHKDVAQFIKPVTLGFLIFWVASTSNYLIVYDLNIYPLGNIADAVVSVFILRALFENKKENLRLFQICSGLAALTVGILAAFFWQLILPDLDSKFFMLLKFTASALAGLLFLAWFIRKPTMLSLMVVNANLPPEFDETLKDTYELTNTEILICRELRTGSKRASLRKILGLSESGLKNHLKSIYAKTIEKHNTDASNNRDKLQRLTIFLMRIG